MRFFFPVIIIGVLLLISGCTQTTSDPGDTTENPQPTPPPKPGAEQFTCGELDARGNAFLDEANYCEDDSDCSISTEFGCPFGCFNLVNKNADLTGIRMNANAYDDNCSKCIYECTLLPKLEDIRCEQNKCTLQVSAPSSIYPIDPSQNIIDEIENAIKSQLGK
jgi:hypothetical protein